jgi:acetyltransferase-like isoleucine patch superfamily enzyme
MTPTASRLDIASHTLQWTTSMLKWIQSFWSSAVDAMKTQVHLAQVLVRFPTTAIARPNYWRFDTLDAIEIGEGVTVGPFVEVIAYSRSPRSRVPGRLILRTGSIISAGCNLRAAGGLIDIGTNSALGQHTVVVAANHALAAGTTYLRTTWNEERTGVIVGNNCWIGANCTILPGVTIGDDAVIGAGSVVTKSVPAGELWAGVPARPLKRLR